jgi:hypothetical protein
LPNAHQILNKSYLVVISELLLKSEICVASDHSRIANVSTEHLKHFNSNFGHGAKFHLQAGPRPVHCFFARSTMHWSESEQLSDDSGTGDDPHRSSAVPNSLLQLQGDFASGSDSVVPSTPEKEFNEQDWQ